MAKVTVKKEQNYTIISNDIFKDIRLSFKAKGLLTTMLSCPPNWNYTIEGLSKISKDGKASIRSALAELEEFGYLERKQLRDEKGSFTDLEYVVYEKPKTKNPISENPTTDNPISENRTQLNTIKSNTDKLNTNGLSTDKLNTDIISPTELNTNEFATSPTGLHTSLSDERKADGKSKEKWVITKKHIVSVMDKLGYGELADETQSAIEIFRYYYMMYKQKTGNPHPRLNDKTMTDTLNNFIMGFDEVSEHDVDTYEMLIDEHFKNNYGMNIDWSIRHFMTEDIRNMLYCRTR